MDGRMKHIPQMASGSGSGFGSGFVSGSGLGSGLGLGLGLGLGYLPLVVLRRYNLLRVSFNRLGVASKFRHHLPFAEKLLFF